MRSKRRLGARPLAAVLGSAGVAAAAALAPKCPLCWAALLAMMTAGVGSLATPLLAAGGLAVAAGALWLVRARIGIKRPACGSGTGRVDSAHAEPSCCLPSHE